MIEWLVRLKGHQFDLEYLSTAFDSPKWRVTEKEGCHYLQSSDFDVLTDAGEVRLHAQNLLQFMNGAAKIQHGRYQPVEVDAVSQVNEDGTRHIFIAAVGTIVARSRASAISTTGGSQDSPKRPTCTESLLAIADQDAKVKEALRMFGSLEPTWANLHKVFEFIQLDIGGTMFEAGWTTKGEVNRFTQTANSALAIGDDARHPINEKKFQPPKKPMSLAEAKSLIRTLLPNWIRSKRQ